MARPNMRTAAAAAMLMALTACTMKNQDAPPLTGPSEQGTSLQLMANPDVLTQDGGSQSAITVVARGPNGQPLPGLSIRVDVTAKDVTSQQDVVTDVGRLSARNIVTDGSGRADVMYTAPLAHDVPETTVGIRFIPVGTDGANSVPRTITIRLLPEGTVGGGGVLDAKITGPDTAEVGEPVTFDASESTSATGVIKKFSWNFGDGSKAGTGESVTHSFSKADTFTVTLTITDPYDRTDTDSKSIVVSAVALPTASFTWLPSTPTAGNTVTFDASASSAASGHSIVKYQWQWQKTTGGAPPDTRGPLTTPVTTYSFPLGAGDYVVTLTVTDDTGQTDVQVSSVTIS